MTTTLYSHHDLMGDKINFNSQVPVIAHGDSWGSFGSLPTTLTGSVFEHFDFGKNVAIVNYAIPGLMLTEMPDAKRFSMFHLAMTLKGMPHWRALLISGGGNDLIDWVRRSPQEPLSHRILRYQKNDEWLAPELGPARYVSQVGWGNLCQTLMAAYEKFNELRLQCYPAMTLVTHVYDYMTPRFAPAIEDVGGGPWLAPSFKAAGIPQDQWPQVAHLLVDWFHEFLTTEVRPHFTNFVVLDTRGAAVPAVLGSTGVSNDWANEIHLTDPGYAKLAHAKCNGSLTALAVPWKTGALAL